MTPDKVRTLAPEFKNDSDDEIQVFLDIAFSMMSVSAWGGVFGVASAYLAAHIKLVAAQGDPTASGAGPGAGTGAVGPVTSVKVGRWATTFGGGLNGSEKGLDAGADGSLVGTRHGRMYLMLRKSRPAGKSKLIVPKG